jgi:urease accessory protein
MPWHARLQLDYRLQAGKTVARYEHSGPLRILQSFYPEGDAICHNVLVHPPGGLVGGDTLDVAINFGAGTHALLTTPGATRFYRSDGEIARQSVTARLEAGSRLEWLPLEALAYNACLAENHARFELAPGAEMIGWDVTALGLPSASLPFASGSFAQHIEVPGVWLERARIAADDTRLMDSPLGLAGQRCLATLFFVAGSDIARPRRDAALDAARALIDTHSLRLTAGATAPNSRVVVVRVLSPLVEPAMGLLRQVWAAWRTHFWAQSAQSPRIWAL